MTKPRSPKSKLPQAANLTDAPPPGGESLIERFVKFRKAEGLTQEEAAAQMGMSVNSLRTYERKSRTPNGPATLKILAFVGALK